MPYLDKAGLTYFWGKVKTIIGGKVDKETGKGLSSNDYTTAEKTKLSGIETQANKTTIANNLTTTVAGSALDATKGKALSDTITAFLERYKEKAQYVQYIYPDNDLNKLIKSGMYQVATNWVSNPAPIWSNASLVLVLGGGSSSDSRILQIIVKGNAQSDMRIAYRKCYPDPTVASNWTEWTVIETTYMSGDTVTYPTRVYAQGVITSSHQALWFTIPLTKPCSSVSSISADIYVRNPMSGGYFLQNKSLATFGATKAFYATPSGITVSLTNITDDLWDNIPTNNLPTVVEILNMSITF